MAASSNFAAPQFVGMWRDVQWHQKLTSRLNTGENTLTFSGQTPAFSDTDKTGITLHEAANRRDGNDIIHS